MKATSLMSDKLKATLGELTDGRLDIEQLFIQQLDQNEYAIDNVDTIAEKSEYFDIDNAAYTKERLSKREVTRVKNINQRATTLDGVDKCPYCCDTDFCNVNCIHAKW